MAVVGAGCRRPALGLWPVAWPECRLKVGEAGEESVARHQWRGLSDD